MTETETDLCSKEKTLFFGCFTKIRGKVTNIEYGNIDYENVNIESGNIEFNFENGNIDSETGSKRGPRGVGGGGAPC
jgi:hypothetical protein